VLARDVKLPLLSMLAITVAPYLNTSLPPDSTMLNPVVTTEPELPVVAWLSVGKVQLVRVPEDGVPKAGVTSVGLLDSTTEPVPVELVTPVPPDATDRVADSPAAVPVVF